MIRIGTRKSELALWQANQVKDQLDALGANTILVPLESEGDQNLIDPLYKMGIQGVFTKTLDAALLNNKIDQGSQIQIFTSFADLMEIAKFEKDENTFLDLSSKLYNLLNNFEKIENKFFIDIFKNAFSSKFKNAVYSKQNIIEILS